MTTREVARRIGAPPILAAVAPVMARLTTVATTVTMIRRSAGATSIALVMLVVSFVLLLTVNRLQAWTRQRTGQTL